MDNIVSFDQMIDKLKSLTFAKPSLSDAYNAGFDAGVNGVNDINTHFSFFGSPELSKQWNMGKKDGETAQ